MKVKEINRLNLKSTTLPHPSKSIYKFDYDLVNTNDRNILNMDEIFGKNEIIGRQISP